MQPLETEFGRKRRIDQSNCNKDFSCLEGLLPLLRDRARRPSPRKPSARGGARSREPMSRSCRTRLIPTLDKFTFDVIVTGVGGTGVVTLGAILGMAAHLEGKGLGMIDMAGLAQKGGAVFSHVRLAATSGRDHVRIRRHGRPWPTWYSAATSS